jgi:hypothetical protein
VVQTAGLCAHSAARKRRALGFYADLFGASYEDTGGDGQTYAIEMPVIEQLHELIDARQRFAHGVQTLWFDHPNCIAFSRSGTDEDPGCVVVLSTAMREKSADAGRQLWQ